MTSKRINAGFTMVELIVVIVILGILSATALPRFMSLDGAAGRSVVQATAGAFKSAVIMANAAYRANGAQSLDNQFGDIDMFTSGYPINTNTTDNTTINCGELWNGLMEDAPALGTDITATTGAVDSNDWAAMANTTDNTCTYKHRTGGTNDNMYFVYDADDGTVAITAN